MPNQWSCYNISYEKWYIIKKPSNITISVEKIIYSINYFKEKFSKFIPETTLNNNNNNNEDNSYSLKQVYIEWQTLKESKTYKYEELNKLLDFINKSISILLNEWKYFDIVWYQWNEDFLKYKWIRKRIKHYNTINNFFDSTNFVIDENYTPYFVDNIATYWIYEKNNFFNKIYRYILLLWYKNQIRKKLKNFNFKK